MNDIKNKALKRKDLDIVKYCEAALRELDRLEDRTVTIRDNKKFCGTPIEVTGYEIIKGRVQKVFTTHDCESFQPGSILLSYKTSVEFLPAIIKASAIVTEQVEILCYAACVCRELKIPGVVGVAGIIEHICDGDLVEIDLKKGTVIRLNKN